MLAVRRWRAERPNGRHAEGVLLARRQCGEAKGRGRAPSALLRNVDGNPGGGSRHAGGVLFACHAGGVLFACHAGGVLFARRV
jgi:hypothetical protein